MSYRQNIDAELGAMIAVAAFIVFIILGLSWMSVQAVAWLISGALGGV